MPTNQGIRLEDGECLQTAGPEPIEPDPEQAFATAETQLAVFMDDHCQLLPEREDLQMDDGPPSEQASQGGEQGEEDCFHPLDATARGWKKSTESISTRFLVGTGQGRSVIGWTSRRSLPT